MILRVVSILGCLVFGIATVWMLNYGIIESIIIPDPCAYHSEESSVLFDMFYTVTSDEGYHPYPTLLNFALTLTLGFLLAFTAYRYWKALWEDKSN